LRLALMEAKTMRQASELAENKTNQASE